jgi:hypothetical protein
MVRIECPETSVQNCLSTLRDIAEEGKSHTKKLLTMSHINTLPLNAQQYNSLLKQKKYVGMLRQYFMKFLAMINDAPTKNTSHVFEHLCYITFVR